MVFKSIRNVLHPVGQVTSEPLKKDTTDSLMLQFAEEYFMVNSVKCFGEAEENSEGRASILLSCSYLGMKKDKGM